MQLYLILGIGWLMMGQAVATTSDTVLVRNLSPVAKQQLLEDAMLQSLECLAEGHDSLRKYINSQVLESMKDGHKSTRIDGVDIPYGTYSRLLVRAGSTMIENIRTTFASSEEYQSLLTESIGDTGVNGDRIGFDFQLKRESVAILLHTVGVPRKSLPESVQLTIALFIKAFKLPVDIDGFIGRVVDTPCL
jgi:hypothetical protein